MVDKNHIILEKIIGYIDKVVSYAGDLDQTAFLDDTKPLDILDRKGLEALL